jgi:PHP family Zn ribbon phosphoesterase
MPPSILPPDRKFYASNNSNNATCNRYNWNNTGANLSAAVSVARRPRQGHPTQWLSMSDAG